MRSVVSGFSRTVLPQQPEILLDPAETRALRALVDGVHAGRIDLAAAQRSTPAEPMVLAFVCVVALASTAGQAQEKAPAPAAATRSGTPINATPLKVQVVIARYQGEKKISSLPYTLTMNANNHASLRMGTSMPGGVIPLDTSQSWMVSVW